ncbi:hypothetical protein [Pseudomonas sp. B7]|jgi:hypothetical protein|uniref:hypothetical protein n=1 Tax=Pseudomonas sp. B7 TaxID=360962 RepID=UPI00191EA823|nr:hypothetical protein [Pseudomonas sp. B7]MBL0795317.1 hypothetical protein [Pseudomonas sp. B7]
MKRKLEFELQPIRVPSDWTITINNLYEVELTSETAHWFSSSVLLGGARKSTGYCFDSRVEPEGDPNGEFVVEFLTIEYDKKGEPIGDSVRTIELFKTKNKKEYIEKIETYMLEN